MKKGFTTPQVTILVWTSPGTCLGTKGDLRKPSKSVPNNQIDSTRRGEISFKKLAFCEFFKSSKIGLQNFENSQNILHIFDMACNTQQRNFFEKLAFFEFFKS